MISGLNTNVSSRSFFGDQIDGKNGSSRCRFYGPSKNINFADFLQFVIRVKHSEVVRIRTEGQEGVIHLLHGEALYAKVGEQQEFQAFYHMVTLNSGHFEYVYQETQPDERNLLPGTLHLIMEALRRKDEYLSLIHI